MTEEYVEAFKKVAKGGGITFLGTTLGYLLAYFGMLAIARYLGPSDYGLISLASAITAMIANFIPLGIPQGVLRYVSFYKGLNDTQRIKGTITSAMWIVTPLSLAASIILFFASEHLSLNVFNSKSLIPVLKAFSPTVFFLSMFYVFQSAILGFQEIKYVIFLREIFQNASRFSLIIVALLFGYGVYGATLAYVSATILTSILSFYYLIKVFKFLSKKIKSTDVRHELLSFSWPLMFAGMIGSIVAWIDTLMVGYFYTPYQVGVYRAALTTAWLLSLIPTWFSTIFMPIVTEMYGQKKMAEIKKLNASVTKWVFIITLPFALLAITFSKEVLNVLYGSKFVEGFLAFTILIMGYSIVSVLSLNAQFLQISGMTKFVMFNGVVAAIVDITLNYSLIPIYGINGAAIATAIAVTISSSLAFIEVYKKLLIQPFGKVYFRIVLVFVILGIGLYYLPENVNIVGLRSIFLVSVLFLALNFALMTIFRIFDENDILIIKAVRDKIKL